MLLRFCSAARRDNGSADRSSSITSITTLSISIRRARLLPPLKRETVVYIYMYIYAPFVEQYIYRYTLVVYRRRLLDFGWKVDQNTGQTGHDYYHESSSRTSLRSGDDSRRPGTK